MGIWRGKEVERDRAERTGFAAGREMDPFVFRGVSFFVDCADSWLEDGFWICCSGGGENGLWWVGVGCVANLELIQRCPFASLVSELLLPGFGMV